MPKFKVMDRNKLVVEDAAEIWADGGGTKEIADVMHCWEHDVYNNLSRIKKIARGLGCAVGSSGI